MRKAKELLDRLTRYYPPDNGCSYALTLQDGLFVLTVKRGGKFKNMHIEDKALEKPVEWLFSEIKKFL